MKIYLYILFSFIGSLSLSAQNTADLSYPEIDSLLNLYEGNLQYDKGIKLSIDVSNISGKQDSLCGEYLEWAAYFYEISNQNEKAIQFYSKTLCVFEKAIGKNTQRYATTLSFLGIFHYNMGNFNKALPLYIQAKNVIEKALGKDHPKFATSLHNLALLHDEMGNFDKALPLLIQAINIYEKALEKDHPSFATSLHNLARMHDEMGNFDKALPLLIQAINITEKALGKDHPSFANSLNSLASLHQSMGNFDKALPLLIQAINITEKALGKDHPSFANSLNNLALLHKSMGDFDKALPLYLQAINIYEKALGKDHPLFANSLNNLAGLHQRMGDFDLALSLVIQCIKITEKALGMDHPSFATSLNNLALLHQSMGNFDKAWTMLGLAMNSSASLSLSHNFDIPWMDSLKNAPFASNLHLKNMVISLRRAYFLLKQDSATQDAIIKQINVSDVAIALLAKQRKEVSNEKDKLRMLSQSNDWLLRSLDVLNPQKNRHKAFNQSDQNKSVLLLQATKSEQAYRLGHLPDSLVWKDKKMLKKQSELQAKLLEKRSTSEKDNLRNQLNHLNQDIDDFIKMIEKEYPKYHKLKYQQVDAKVQDIQALLDGKTALIEYVVADSLLHIFKVDKNEVLWLPHPLDKKELQDNIKALHKALSDYKLLSKDTEKAYRNYSEKAYWFYQNTIEPILNGNSDIEDLIIVSDGELGHLPFETFLVEQAPQSLTHYNELHYLVNDYNISYHYSATLWKENKEAPQPNNNGQILAMAANYGIQLDSALMDVRLPTDQSLRNILKPLPAARKEVETLQEKYQGFFAFDTLASEKTVKEKAADFAILHFATHGILDSKRPILSSLAFTEDKDSIESNFWQAHEISKMELNADLVVLSACETGYGRFEKGNGIASLARAFMYAGSPALIVSLWQVNDFATSEIMKNLYDNLADGMKKDEALRHAKLQYMKSAKGIAAHPAFWSPFIMMGNTEPVSIKRKGNPMAWRIGIGVLALLGIGGFMLSRRKKEVA